MKGLRAVFSVLFAALVLSACGGGGLNPPASGAAPMSAGAHLNARGALGSGYKQLYRFKGTPDGASPYAGLLVVNGILYGTTLNGSTNYCSQNCGNNNCYLGCGTVFSVSSAGAEHIVYNFDGNFNGGKDGSWPFDGLTALNGALYGTTSSAGASAHGTVFTVSTSGQEQALYSFGGGTDAAGPEAGLTALNGKLYGTTLSGGGSGCGGGGCGTVFSVTTTGIESVLYRFAGGSDGERLYSGVVAVQGRLYGATLFGGGSGCGGNGCGTIFEVSLNGKEHVLYRFTGGADGGYPNGLIAVNGVLYGTTESGGPKNSGTFFSVTRAGVEKVLYNFQDIPDGNLPGANLIYVKGNFYGTTVGGGTAGDGTVFSVNKSGTEQVLYSFKGGTDGLDPQAPVVAHNGLLYGTTTQGGGTGCGGNGCGTIFKLRE